MLAKIGVSLLLATLAICDPKGHTWQHPLPTDRRSPCPAINALANHGYLPRRGLNISLEQFITGAKEGLNFDKEFTMGAVGAYQPFTTTGYNNTLNLNDLDHHSIPGEFDGSLSRNDVYFGDNHSFNKKIFDTVAAYFHHDTISIPTAAKARRHRYAAAQAINPTFTPAENLSLATTAMYLKAMQGQDKQTKTKYVQIFFRQERIPFNEGYKISNVTITNDDILLVADKINAAT
ncbi:MAG: hypothetical protein L6R40_007744 [Gallowayella cf. fulva]|nr:MAG: hypothetical protein L6R40_007744 [Xanthomendoza cf. fulva]